MDDLVTSLKRASEGLKLASVAWKARGGKWVVEGEALSEISIVTDSAASEISRLRGEVENFKQAGAEWRSQALVHADELANLRATNERLGWAVESAAVVFEQVYGNAELAEKVRAAALTATQEKGNGNGRD